MLYTKIARPLLFALNPEWVHHRTLQVGRLFSRSRVACGLFRRLYGRQYDELRIQTMGLSFANPVGLAAGFDKRGLIYEAIGALGFGHMEIGSVSERPWPGNPSPTLLRLQKDGALINRPGLNSEGADVVHARLRGTRFTFPVGLNLVKTADPQVSGAAAVDDFERSFKKLYPLSSFVTLNLSCPNTAEGRTFEDPELLRPFLARVQEHRNTAPGEGRKPVLVKLSPDLKDSVLDGILELAEQHGIDGCVIANTTTRRENLRTPTKVLETFGFGGLSGRPLKPYTRELIRKVAQKAGNRFTIVACGGVGCDPARHPAEEVWEYLNLGATLVQLHTGLIYRGPALAAIINRGLCDILKRNNIASLSAFLAARK